MSEPIPAHIYIGGRLPRSLVEEFCEAVANEGVMRNWEEGFEPHSAEDILQALDENRHLHLTEDSANYGVMSEIEPWCEEHGISFDRYCDAKYEYNGEMVRFRPGGEAYHFNATQDGEIQIGWEDVAPIVEQLTAARDMRIRDLREAASQAAEDLRSLFGQDIGELPPLEIVEG